MKVTPAFHGAGSSKLLSDSHPSGRLFLLYEMRDLAAADRHPLQKCQIEEHLYLEPSGAAPFAVRATVVVGGALVTLIVRSHIEACGHFGGDGHNSHSPAEFGTLKLEKVKHELF